MIAATSGAAAQNPASIDALATPNGGTAAQGIGPDAASALGAVDGASATAAAAASAARVITALATTTAADEKRVQSGSDPAPAAADGSTAAAQAAANAAPTTSPDAAAVTTMKVSANVDSSEFGQGVANQISTMVDSNISSAKLQVNPPALGPIEVRIALQGDHAQVWMVSHSAVTRDALQASTPTLREMLGDQGFGQVSVDISQGSFQDRAPTAQSYDWNAGAERSDYSAAPSAASSTARTASGIVDAYA
jgi:flagellar hook-length control protein FliK